MTVEEKLDLLKDDQEMVLEILEGIMESLYLMNFKMDHVIDATTARTNRPH